MSGEIAVAGNSRVWVVEFGAAPGRSFEYEGCMKIGDTSWPQGDVTRIECPDPNRYGGFVEVEAVSGAVERVGTQLIGRYPMSLSTLLELTRRRCRFDIHVHVGKCKNPQDFNSGWDKIRVYREASITEWSDENAGAIESGDQNPTNETAEISAAEIYEIVPIAFAEKAAAVVARETTAIVVCDSVSCGDCDDISKGCEKVFALQVGVGATPGTKPSVIHTGDAGLTFGLGDITTMHSNERPTGAACVAGNLIVVSTTGGMHYADLVDILAGTETWTEVTAGFDGTHFPTAIDSVDARHTWMVGTTGYIWFASDPTVGVIEQDPGLATVQNLLDVEAYDSLNVVAVGNLNALVFTKNGGITWQSVTGPSVGVNLTAVWMHTATTWFVGNALGALYYTTDSGLNWTQIAIPGAPSYIDDIKFVDDTVGYLAIRRLGPAGSILRTRDGGATWYILPEKAATGTIPANDRLNMLAVCPTDHNLVWGAGLGDNGTDGFIVKAS